MWRTVVPPTPLEAADFAIAAERRVIKENMVLLCYIHCLRWARAVVGEFDDDATGDAMCDVVNKKIAYGSIYFHMYDRYGVVK